MVDIEVTRETPDGRKMTCLTVTVGDTKKMVAMDLEKITTQKQVASALRVLAMTLDPPDLPGGYA
jgi:hypothetical protein